MPGERVHLMDATGVEAPPYAWFELPHAERPLVFLFTFQPSWARDSAELVLNTACSILSGSTPPRRCTA